MQSISLNNSFAERIRASRIFELVTPLSFALTVFRLLPGSASNAQELECVNAFNKAFYSDLQSRPDLALTQTLLGEVFYSAHTIRLRQRSTLPHKFPESQAR